MRVPISWLKEFIDFSEPPERLQEIFTMRGLEVESIETIAGEQVVVVELTPNRGDCASILGIARELSSYLGKPYNIPGSDYSCKGEPVDRDYNLKVEIPQKCPLYYLKLIRNVKISESPEWLKDRLRFCGVRPVNNVVDITNYVMLEYGQPLHAFDAGKISEKTIFVRAGRENEKILTLDGSDIGLSADDIVIADGKNPIAIGGVIGGENSSVSSDTHDILLESAFFIPESISRTERRSEIKTESSYRFARHVDIEGVRKAFERAVHLIAEICDGEPAPGELFEKNSDLKSEKILIILEKIKKILGVSIEAERIKQILESLDFKVEINCDKIHVTVPSFRNDVLRPIDVIEEIARVYGYENINATLPESKITTNLFRETDICGRIEEILRASGYWETVTHSLISGDNYRGICGIEIYEPVEIANPVNINMNILRPNLIFGLLDICKYNINQKQSPVKFYERGPVFYRKNGEKFEINQIAFVAESDDYFEAKKNIMVILEGLKQEFKIEYQKKSDFFEPEKNGDIIINGSFAGEFGCLNEKICKLYRFASKKFIAGYINTDYIDRERIINRAFTKWSPYPSVFRDLSLVVPAHLTHSEIYDKILTGGGRNLAVIRLYDMYQDEKLGKDKKSMTYMLEFNSEEKTMTSSEIDEKIEGILKILNNDLGITLRPDIV